MPKSLSLKKAKSEPSKNQKQITQFFKNSSDAIVKSTFFATDLQQNINKINKRKATSPVNLTEDDCFQNDDFLCTKSLRTDSKKAKKVENTIKEKSQTIGICEKLSIIDESEVNDTHRNEKLNNHNEICDKKTFEIITIDIENDNLLRDTKERSPLSIVANKESQDISNGTHIQYSPTKSNIQLDREKKSPNGKENNIINFNDNAESPKPKNSPKHNSLSPNISTPKKNQNKGGKEKDITNIQSVTTKCSPDLQSTSRNINPEESQLTPKKEQKDTIPLRRSPRIAKLKISPKKVIDTKLVRGALDFGEDMNEMFDEVWDKADFSQTEENLDLSMVQRCEVTNMERFPTRLELKLKSSDNKTALCFVEGIWKDVPVVQGDIVSILAKKSSENTFSVNNSTGLLVLRPDHLMSSTSVVSGVFCRRKAVLQERFKGLDSGNVAMTIGILVHELVQRALTQKISATDKLRKESELLVKDSIHMVYDAGLSLDEVHMSMNAYIPALSDFIQMYVLDNSTGHNTQKGKWNGRVDDVLDIEENICCSQLGLKGKIDATLQVTLLKKNGKESSIMPLELKSGRASGSVEHRGQLVLYGMMLALLRNRDPAHDADQTGLLLYLKDKIDLREVKCGYPERRDLVMLRNQLVQYLAPGPLEPDCDNIPDIEEASHLLRQELPDPVHHQTACEKCPYLTICSLHLWHTQGPRVTDTHPLSRLRDAALGHLSPAHVRYFLRWAALLKMEERGQTTHAPLHALWTETPEKRAQRGTCKDNLFVKSVEASGDRFIHVFQCIEITKSDKSRDSAKGPQEGEFAIVSTDNRPWVAAGTILVMNQKEVHMLLERDLSRRHSNTTAFQVDMYESYASTVQNLTNLGALLDDNNDAAKLRRLIIDLELPEFELKLPREVGRLGSKLMKSLNIEQQRAVLRAIAAKDYALLQGLPGTGKTQTISVLILMLVALKKRVLVTAHTHSAVDTVLIRLPTTLKILRLGNSSRVAPAIRSCCEHELTKGCTTPDDLARLYESMEVVGVTCLGASHTVLSKTTFDVCIVDEATQVLQCTVLRPLFAASRFVLVGDPAQLPPVVRSHAARKLGMEDSLFGRLNAVGDHAQCTLRLQYRMNGALTELANRVAYHDRLRCASEAVRNATLGIDFKKASEHNTKSPWLLTACSPSRDDAVIFFDTGPADFQQSSAKSTANRHEALIVLSVLNAMIMGGVSVDDIGVIAPYREQVTLLRNSCSRLVKTGSIEISTVDQFQGKDKSVIIFSCTKSCSEGNENRNVKEGEILNDPRRLAVSVTRAKHKFVAIGDVNTLRRYEPFQKLFTACNPVALPNEWREILYKDFGHLL